ncbi:hypothetical protein MMC31_003470 [Peltigera leucophlebia]|nr:hypothetical protein [Peltigera leucophlebia]
MSGFKIVELLWRVWLPTSTFFLGVGVTIIVLRRRVCPAEAPQPDKPDKPDSQVSTAEPQITTGLGNFSKLPIKIRLLIWQQLVPKVVYHSNSLMVARQKSQDISPLLVASREIFSEFSAELYRNNPVCYFPIDFMDRSFTWANCRFFGPKANADFPRFDVLRIEIYAPSITVTGRALRTWKDLTEWVFGEVQYLLIKKLSDFHKSGRQCPRVELALLPSRNVEDGDKHWSAACNVGRGPGEVKKNARDEWEEIMDLMVVENKHWSNAGTTLALCPALIAKLDRLPTARRFLLDLMY